MLVEADSHLPVELSDFRARRVDFAVNDEDAVWSSVENIHELYGGGVLENEGPEIFLRATRICRAQAALSVRIAQVLIDGTHSHAVTCGSVETDRGVVLKRVPELPPECFRRILDEVVDRFAPGARRRLGSGLLTLGEQFSHGRAGYAAYRTGFPASSGSRVRSPASVPVGILTVTDLQDDS